MLYSAARVLLTSCLVTAFLLASVTSAHAASSKRAVGPYGHTTITYNDVSRFREATALAVLGWNRSGMPFQLVPARAGAKPDILIRSTPTVRAAGQEAGGIGGIGVGVVMSERNNRMSARTVRAIGHELGHALGLAHSLDPCGLMGNGGDSHPAAACHRGEKPLDGWWRCGPSTADVSALARQYGLRLKAGTRRGYCNINEVPAAARAFKVQTEAPTIISTETAQWNYLNWSVTSPAIYDARRNEWPAAGMKPVIEAFDTRGTRISPGFGTALVTEGGAPNSPKPRHTYLQVICEKLPSTARLQVALPQFNGVTGATFAFDSTPCVSVPFDESADAS